jgi:hypothetical protein
MREQTYGEKWLPRAIFNKANWTKEVR